MASFSDYLTNPDYIKAHGVIRHGDSEKGFIFIENEKDISFWKIFFGEDILKSYEFNMASGPNNELDATRGKPRFERLLKDANKLAIFAIDSDFDHLTPNRYEHCNYLINNDFVIHTYGYGKESYLNCREVLNDCMGGYYFFKPNSHTFCDFLCTFSEIIYRPLIKYLYLLNENKADHNEKEFHNNIIPNKAVLYEMYFNSNYESFVESVEQYEARLDSALSNTDLSDYINMCEKYGLNTKTSYQYINGHTLEDKIINEVVLEIKNRIQQAELSEFIRSGAQGQAIQDRRNELKNHFSNNVNFNTLKNCSKVWIDNILYQTAKENQLAIF
ncbi:DUF4435 domain-containing protein [Vibrio sp. YYF0003]|uniref:DUF4435 domain-containing protein n=1 Tax=Vibrio sp. YYF0003 TaxID=3116646 RepID=UPI002EBDF816|nr:DUF4435 domain-containing protein [Vibrio sp. YYF0003]